MQPRLITHSSAARSWIMGKAMTVPERCSTVQVSIQAGRGSGARFMKKKSPCAPWGYRFITMARSLQVGQQHRRHAHVVREQVALGDRRARARTACAGW